MSESKAQRLGSKNRKALETRVANLRNMIEQLDVARDLVRTPSIDKFETTDEWLTEAKEVLALRDELFDRSCVCAREVRQIELRLAGFDVDSGV